MLGSNDFFKKKGVLRRTETAGGIDKTGTAEPIFHL